MRPHRLQQMVISWIAGICVLAPLAGRPTMAHQTTTRLNVSSFGAQAAYNWSQWASISADGRYVAFESLASNLVQDDTNEGGPSLGNDVFVRDRETGLTTRVNVTSAGQQANRDSYWPSISADGHVIAFTSIATNLVSGDSNSVADVFVHDTQTGQTSRISVSSSGAQANGFSLYPAISGDGRYLAFESLATNLVPDDTNAARDVFVHDRQTGRTTRASIDSSGGQGNDLSWNTRISGDGRFIVFQSIANNLIANDTNGVWDVFVHDWQTGQTARVSVDSAGAQGNDNSINATISADGRIVAFTSAATNLAAGDSNGWLDVFAHDRQTGQTGRVSVSTAGAQANAYSDEASLWADGRYVAFSSNAGTLLLGDSNLYRDVFVHDRLMHRTRRASLAFNSAQGNFDSSKPSISADGMLVAYQSEASNFVPGDTNVA